MHDRVPKKVVIDPGHGGADPGTSANGIVEKDYNLKISKYMSKRLGELGIPNTLTRDTDETLSPSSRVNRIKNIYGTGNDVLVISNHLNSGGGDGAEIIYALRNSDNFASRIADNMKSSGQNVRKYYQRRLPSNPSKDYYFIIRDTSNNETILMEYGFVDSSKDDISQIKNNYEQLAEAVVKSIAEYIGVPYKKPSDNYVSNDNYYIVQKGDTLWSIASKFKTTVSKIKELNKLTNNLITVGQKLIVNDDSNISEEYFIYTVVKGDNLWDIANKYKTTVDKLKVINNLNSNLLQIGQKLKVPKFKMQEYIVQKEDTLYSISRKFGTTVTDIIELNNLKTTVINVGQKLLIP